jgi:hypothetical protein
METKDDIQLNELEAIEQKLNTEAPLESEATDGSAVGADHGFLIT